MDAYRPLERVVVVMKLKIQNTRPHYFKSIIHMDTIPFISTTQFPIFRSQQLHRYKEYESVRRHDQRIQLSEAKREVGVGWGSMIQKLRAVRLVSLSSHNFRFSPYQNTSFTPIFLRLTVLSGSSSPCVDFVSGAIDPLTSVRREIERFGE